MLVTPPVFPHTGSNCPAKTTQDSVNAKSNRVLNDLVITWPHGRTY
jgi:hypothetical protein